MSKPSASATVDLKKIRKAIKLKGAKWTAGETSVSRLAPKMRAGLLSKKPFGPIVPARPLPGPIPPLPAVFDWTNVDGINYVTSVKQQYAGTCTSFASTAALESCVLRLGIVQGADIDLSERSIYTNPNGCDGNLHGIAAFMQNTGLPPEEWFPADASVPLPGWEAAVYKLTEWDCFYPTKVDEVKALLVENGPVVTTMNCPLDFLHYTGDIYSNIGLPSQGFHAILVVGYDDGEQCFKAKNSWGSDWGEKGTDRPEKGYCRIAYSEFKGPIVNFGWDIHTYPKAIGPRYHADVDASGFVSIDPLALLLREDVYIKLRLPDPAPIDVIRESVRKIVRRMNPEQKRVARVKFNSLKAYIQAIEKELTGKN